MLSVLIFLFPRLYGEGYDTIELLLNGTSAAEWDTVMNNSMFYGYGNLLQVYLMLIILLKVFASSATNGGGGCGGIFAPSLYLGCIAGFVFSHFSNDFAFSAYLPEKNFALMGMAGVMSGVMHAPLTGSVPDSRADRRLRFVPAVDDCVCQFLFNDYSFRAS